MVAAAAIALVAACGEESTGPHTLLPATISWMTWPAGVTTAAPGSVRVAGLRSVCGHLQVDVAQDGPSSIEVQAADRLPGAEQICALDAIAVFDTVVPLPRLVTTGGTISTFRIEADGWSLTSGTVRRTFGVLAVAAAPDPTLRAGGRAFLLSDSLGCSWMRREVFVPGTSLYVLSSDVTVGAGWIPAFVTGFFAEAFSPRCGQTRVFQITAAEVELAPAVRAINPTSPRRTTPAP